MENNLLSPTLPGSPAPFPANSFKPWPTIFTGLGGVFLLFVVMGIGLGFFLASHGFDFMALQKAATGTFGVQLQGIAEVVVIGFLLLVLPPLAKTSLRGLGFKAPTRSDAGRILGGIVAMAVVLTLLGSALSSVLHAHTPEEAVKVFLGLKSPIAKAGFALFAVVLAPFFEEFVFRLFLFNATRQWWGFWPGAIVSALLFGLAHLQPGGVAVNVALVIPLVLGGFILAWIYDRTGNAWAPMLTHAGFNGLTLLALFVAPQLAT